MNDNKLEMLYICKELVNQLNIEKLKWVVYKGKYHYLDGFCGLGDIDIYLNEKDSEKIHVILKKNGFVHVKTQPYLVRQGVEDWIGEDRDTGKLAHVHLHFRIVFGNEYVNQYRFLLEDKSLELADVDEAGIRSQNVLIESILLSCMYKKKCIGKEKLMKYREGLHDALKCANSNKELADVISESDKELLVDFWDNPLDFDNRLLEHFDCFCTEEVKFWRIEYYYKRFVYFVLRIWMR